MNTAKKRCKSKRQSHRWSAFINDTTGLVLQDQIAASMKTKISTGKIHEIHKLYTNKKGLIRHVYKQLLYRSQKGEFRSLTPHLYLADVYAELGREEEARTHAAEVLRISPKFSLEMVSKINTYGYKDPAHLERRLNALRKAGIPE